MNAEQEIRMMIGDLVVQVTTFRHQVKALSDENAALKEENNKLKHGAGAD